MGHRDGRGSHGQRHGFFGDATGRGCGDLSAAEMDDRFEVEGLREEVGQRDGFDCVAVGDEGAQVAGERGGVAGDVDQRGHGDGGEERDDFCAEAGAGRVDYDEVRRFGWARVAEKLKRVGVEGFANRATQIVNERGFGGGCGFYGDHALEATAELASEEAYAGEEIPGQLAALALRYAVDEAVDEPAIDLEECALIDAIVEAGGGIAD